MYLASQPAEFDQIIWCLGETPVMAQGAPRLKMADGLVASQKLLGRSEQEIDAMLGVPTRTEHFRNFDRVYWLGPERGWFRTDSEWLAIRFNDGKVTEARIVQD